MNVKISISSELFLNVCIPVNNTPKMQGETNSDIISLYYILYYGKLSILSYLCWTFVVGKLDALITVYVKKKRELSS